MPLRFRRQLEWWLEPTRFLALALTLLSLIILAIFIRLHDENLAWGDELRALQLVLSIKQGKFDPEYLFVNYNGHYNVPTYMTIALLTLLTGWNMQIGILISVSLACLILLLFTSIFAADHPRSWVYIMPAFAALIFSVHQDLNWTGNYVGHWFFSIFFFAAALLMLVRFPDTWLGFSFAALFSFIATFSSGNGPFSWIVLIPVLYARGFRHWKYYVAWGILGTIAMGLFISGLSGSSIDSVIGQDLSDRLLRLIRFEFSFLGAVFISRANIPNAMEIASIAIGVSGVGAFIANSALLWKSEEGRRTVLTWISLAGYVVLSGVIIGNRAPESDWSRAYIAWYATFINLFWIAVIAVAYTVIERGWFAETFSLPRIVSLFNIGLLVGLLVLHLIQSNRISETSYVGPDTRYHVAGPAITELCANHYLTTLQADCLKEWLPSTALLATYRLNMFARREPISIMPTSYSAGEPVLVETSSLWNSLVLRDWSLSGVDQSRVVFMFPEDADNLTAMAMLPVPFEHAITEISETNLVWLQDIATSSDTFWIIQEPNIEPRLDELLELLKQEGYEPDSPLIHDPSRLIFVRYSRE